MDGSITADDDSGAAPAAVTLQPATTTSVGAGATSDAIGAAALMVSAAEWSTYLGDTITSVTYDSVGNELLFTYGAAEETVVPGDLTINTTFVDDAGANQVQSTMEVNGTQFADDGTDVDAGQNQDFSAEMNSADTYVYNDAAESTATSMDTINNFDALDTIDLTALTVTSVTYTVSGSDTVVTVDVTGVTDDMVITLADYTGGSAGADTIVNAAGVQTLTGGAGADDFVFASGDTGITLATADTIADFVTTSDDIEMGTPGSYTEADGAALVEATFLTAAAGAFDGTGTDIYVAYNAAASGDAWAMIDMDEDGAVSAGDSFIVLTGINLAGEIDSVDFT